ncbi:hypothetical protein MsAm2_07740 [Methanolapillus ohkumae]|uniref:Uncharacterized protein n=2 Tax=Methanolapillus ohkumae TaxID=3028298 RepID=A0AA96ZWV0_9EURY|nr:hypothetical protein MsAm2_07740 [Methanosarcinaceae archaeon Am2]
MNSKYETMDSKSIDKDIIQNRMDFIQKSREDKNLEIIELELNSADQIYNNMDPSPFYERELNNNADQYIFSAVEEVPLRKKMLLVIYARIDKELTEKKENVVKDAIHMHFERKAKSLERQMRKKTKTVGYSTILGFIFLGFCLAASYWLTVNAGDNSFSQVLGQGLAVIGWVVLWNPVEYLVFDRWEPRKEIRLCKKISKTDIEIIPISRESDENNK